MLLSVVWPIVLIVGLVACGFILGRLWSKDNEAASKQIIANLIAQRDEAVAAKDLLRQHGDEIVAELKQKADFWTDQAVADGQQLIQLQQVVARVVVQLSEAAVIKVQETDETTDDVLARLERKLDEDKDAA